MEECPDIAIVGAGCRFPGANDLDEFWRVLINAENHVNEIPLERWNNKAFYDADKDAAGKIYVKRAGLINGYDEFDPEPFGISDAEAERMDPQQRYVLECVHQALEDGGFTKDTFNGTRTGVYTGSMNDDYRTIFKLHHNDDNSYSATGAAPSIVSNRVSHVYDLHGPSITVDTACSSSLTAVHLARQAIQAGDCDMAICGGVSSIISPEIFIPLCRAGLMSVVGQCQAFCDSADGYARGEGCGILILKKLNQAVKDGNKIWATLKTVANQDGHAEHGLTSPSVKQQIQLLESCYADTCTDHSSISAVDASSVQYIEAHGTGTIAGDRVECQALGSFFSQNRRNSEIIEELLIGSVKTNIGHTESAAGVAGLIKVLLMMKYGKIVPSLHIKKDKSNLKSSLNLTEWGIQVPTTVHEWKPNQHGNRIGCVNSFGFGGSNCHCVLLQRHSFAFPTCHDSSVVKEPLFVVLSDITNDRLAAKLEKFKQDIRETNDSLPCISYTSACHRNHSRCRVGFVASSVEELIEKADDTKVHDKRPALKSNIIFLFSGTGTTWPGMCSKLVIEDACFREEIVKLDLYLQPLAGVSMIKTFENPKSDYSDMFLNHIALFSAQVGLINMWRGYGVRPNAIIGVSLGEVAAAYAAGALDLRSAVEVIYYRSKYLSKCSGGTMMVVTGLNVTDVESLIKRYDQRVTVGVYLSPVACTLTGETETMENISSVIKRIEKERNIRVGQTKLAFDCAYHSHLVDPCLPNLRRDIGSLQSSDKQTLIYSTVTGKIAVIDEFRTVDYWIRNIRQPVRLLEAVRSATRKNENNIFIEIGPRSFFKNHIADISKSFKEALLCLPSMMQNKELEARNSTVVQLYENGIDIDWKHINKKSPLSPLPKNVFQKRNLLFLPEDVKEKFQRGILPSSVNDHLFVKRSANDDSLFNICIGKDKTPFVFHHFLSEEVLVPAALYVEAAFAISQKILEIPDQEISISLEFLNRFYLTDTQDTIIKCEVTMLSEESAELTFSRKNKILCTAKTMKIQEKVRKPISPISLQDSCSVSLSKEDVYVCLQKMGYRYGTSLNLIEKAWCTDSECLAELNLPDSVFSELYRTRIHPAVLDSMFQVAGVIGNASDSVKLVYPKRLHSVMVSGHPGRKMFCYAVTTGSFYSQTHFNFLLLDTSGKSICEVRDFTTKEIDTKHVVERYAYSLDWCLLKDSRETKKETSAKKVVAWCTDTAKKLMELLCDDSVMEFHVVNSECDFKPDQLDRVKTNPHQYKAMICALFVDFELESREPYEIYRVAKQSLLYLKRVLIMLQDKTTSITLPLFVITQNTQAKQLLNVGNLCGSEQWGLVRSVIHEAIYPDIRLVDIDPKNCDKERFLQIIDNGFPSQIELRLEGRKLFTSRLHANDLVFQGNLKRNVDLHKMEEAYLRSVQPRKIVSSFFRTFESMNSMPATIIDVVKLRLISACLHHEAIYPVTENDGEEKYTIWPELSRDGFQALCLEGVGVDESDTDSNTVLLRHNRKYFCYPVNIATHVRVPRHCIFEESDIRFYTPGLLTSSVLTCYLASKITVHSRVCVCTDDKNIYCHELVQEFLGNGSALHIRHRDIVKRFIELKDNQLKETQCVVLLCKATKSDIQYILECFPQVMTILTLSHFIQQPILRWLIRKFPQLEVSVQSSETIFHANKLAVILPRVRSILKHKQLSLHETQSKDKDADENPFSLPYSEVSLSDYNRNVSLCVGDMKLFSKNCCYVVVGGLTGLGWICVEWIAKMGGGYILSVSRRLPSLDQKREIKRLMCDYKCCMKAIKADITNFYELKNVINEHNKESPDIPIKGIFNGAGVLEDCLIIDMTEEKLEKVIMPKILGCINLHFACEDLELDFFMMHSSIVSILGNSGQSNYAAGNSFIDALARHRRSRNLPAQSINWGPLKDIGMLANKPDRSEQLSKRGFNFIEKDDVSVCLKHAVIANDVQVTFGSFNWSLIANNLKAVKLEELIPGHFIAKRTNRDEAVYQFDMESYLQAKSDKKSTLLFDLVKYVLCREFSVTDEALLSLDLRLNELGFESITSARFVQAVFDYTKFNIPLTVMYSFNTTIENIITLLEQNIGKHISDNIATKNILNPNADISFTQRAVLLGNKGMRDKKKSIEVFDLVFEGIQWTAETWVAILKHAVWMNPGFWKHYIRNNLEFEIKHATEESSVLEIKIISFEEMTKDDPREQIEFDLVRELPIKFLIGLDESRAVLRTIFHPVIADLTTALIICRDLMSVGYAKKRKEQFPKRKETVECAHILHTKVNQDGENAKQFWKKELQFVKEPLTLGNMEILEPLDSRHFRIIKRPFPPSMRQQIFDFISSEKITLHQFFTTVYQIFLYIETGSNSVIIPVLAPVDLRLHSKELENVVGRCVNDIPHIAVFEEKQSFRQFLHSNIKRITRAISNSAYPFELILQELSSRNLQENIGRHRICLDDISGYGQINMVGDIEIRLENSWTVSDEFETYLGITTDRKADSLLFEFGFNSGVLGVERGECLPSTIMKLLGKLIENPNEEIHAIPKVIYNRHVVGC